MKIVFKDVNEFSSILAKRGLSQSALAKEAGVTQSYLNQVCNQKRDPGIKFCEKICSALGMEFDDLFKVERSIEISPDFREFGLSFQILIAVSIGLEESIFIQFLIDWESNNAAMKTNLSNGRHWVVVREAQWVEIFPFWSLDTIRNLISSLVERELIIVDGDWYVIHRENIRKACE
ncbi:helix-turn-helix transcriptional regulator [Paenibacillus sp. FSL P2-0322]|uniref:helix-turn-helix transcriptional regulator n=1 Tax=Paenibacillus sp. FSL P2-0322 TaxID=2921628 RepID=UPI0030D065D7